VIEAGRLLGGNFVVLILRSARPTCDHPNARPKLTSELIDSNLSPLAALIFGGKDTDGSVRHASPIIAQFQTIPFKRFLHAPFLCSASHITPAQTHHDGERHCLSLRELLFSQLTNLCCQVKSSSEHSVYHVGRSCLQRDQCLRRPAGESRSHSEYRSHRSRRNSTRPMLCHEFDLHAQPSSHPVRTALAHQHRANVERCVSRPRFRHAECRGHAASIRLRNRFDREVASEVCSVGIRLLESRTGPRAVSRSVFRDLNRRS